jgi:preprotein translocase subunit YajC
MLNPMGFFFYLLQAQGGGGVFGLLLPMVLIFVLFYFMILMPQRKRQKAIDEMHNNLKIGDRVVTSGGIYGTIVGLREDKRSLSLKVSENPVVRIEITRSSVAGLQEGGEESK